MANPRPVKADEQTRNYQHRAQPGVTQAPANEITVSPFAVTVLNDEPRVRDLDLAERLGFDRPRNIRNLIERHRAELDGYGVCFAVKQTSGPKGGRPTTEYYLSEEQSLMLAAVSNAPAASLVRRALITTFVALRRGQAPAALDQPDRKVIGGIVKAIVHKEIADALTEALPLLVAQKLAEDPRRAVIDKVSIRQLLEDEKVPPKGRRSLQRKVFNRLMAYCVQNKIDAYQCAHSKTWLFDRPKATWFIRERCAGLIADHLAKYNGQGILRLVVPKRNQGQ
ncbi:hypothetical protein [Caulobacter segnis]|nr:hypothetical protein [Caulobacter segnis]